MTNEEIMYWRFESGLITLEEYLKTQEPLSETVERIRKAIKEYNNTTND